MSVPSLPLFLGHHSIIIYACRLYQYVKASKSVSGTNYSNSNTHSYTAIAIILSLLCHAVTISITSEETFLWFKKQNFFDSNQFVHCYRVKEKQEEKFLWFKKNIFESNKFVYFYTVKEWLLLFQEISWFFFFPLN